MKNTCIASASLALAAFIVSGLTAIDLRAARAASVSLPRLDAALVDDVLQSHNSGVKAIIKFVNQSSSPVDIYWINYEGRRVLIHKELAMNATHTEGTYLTHPFLVVVSGTGGTTEPDTGLRLAGFLALTTNGDTATITN